MEKERLIGKGMTAEVYKWGQDKALKLYFDRFSDDWIYNEMKIGKAVHEAGVPSPEVFDIIELEGRKGIIFQRISGQSLFKNIQAEPWKLYYQTKRFARLQFKIHQCKALNLPSQKERFSIRIKSSSNLLGNKEKQILDYIDTLPDSTSVCHGDFHFGNIMISGNKMTPIDWTSAYQGNPLGDVARTCLMMNSPSNPLGTPDFLNMPSQYLKWTINRAYLNEYMNLSKASYDKIDAWILPAAAAKLRDKMPGEEKWLLDIINKRLRLT